MRGMDESALDIRWQQRFANYRRALQQLREAVDLAEARPLSRLEQQGLIDENTARQLIAIVTTRYMTVFAAFQTHMQALADDVGG